ncbi:ABC transporter ATP-binding protein [Amycolatopsis jejuensis]|uniref:ABC transporter ATP-binding protein n=1 Tax=Amycolatopsis jejuensis TaxID=330084 RepID=UPI001FE1BF62|nr:oligopeptide/dipeptide ABC transporter ATP-binding protein [Amycolatopsis jejuensis]
MQQLAVEYHAGHGRAPMRAVDGVDLTIAPGETVGLVGESGSGKSTIGRAILGLAPIAEGSVRFGGLDITDAGYRERARLSADLQVVFQDPFSSLSPTRTIGQTLAETLRVHGRIPKAEVDERVEAILRRVGLGPEAARRYPAQFSGGQRQRIAIARALIVRPKLVVCDEPVSSLDLSVQAQVLNLLRELQRDFGLSYLFIAHDLSVVRYLCHRVVILYRGTVMEQGDASAIYAAPGHPYTRALLESAPVPDPQAQRRRRATQVRQDAVSGGGRSSGCPFAARCRHAVEECFRSRPALETVAGGSAVACHRWADLNQGPAERHEEVPIQTVRVTDEATLRG